MGYDSAFKKKMQKYRRDYYEILELDNKASKEALEENFKKLKRKFHPDRTSDPIKKEEYNNKFLLIKEAYQILSEKRSSYDAFLKEDFNEGVFYKERETAINEVEETERVGKNSVDPSNPLSIPSDVYQQLLNAQELAFVQLDDGLVFNRFAKKSRSFSMTLNLEEKQMRLGSVSSITYRASRVCPKCAGQSVHCSYCGNKRVIFVNKALAVKVPPTYLGEVFTLKNVGLQEFGKRVGDLELHIGNFDLNWHFDEKENRYVSILDVPAEKMKSGGMIQMKYFDGRDIFVRLPDGVKHNSIMVMKSKGFSKNGKPTDLAVVVKEEGKVDIIDYFSSESFKEKATLTLGLCLISTIFFAVWSFF